MLHTKEIAIHRCGCSHSHPVYFCPIHHEPTVILWYEGQELDRIVLEHFRDHLAEVILGEETLMKFFGGVWERDETLP